MILVLPDDTEIVYHGEPIIVFPQDQQCNTFGLYIDKRLISTYTTFSFAQEEAIAIAEIYSEPYYIQTQNDYDYVEHLREEYDEDQDEDYQD